MQVELILPINKKLDKEDQIMLVTFMDKCNDVYFNASSDYIFISEKIAEESEEE